MKKLFHWLLLSFACAGMATSCGLIDLDEEDPPKDDGNGGTGSQPTTSLELRLERASTTVTCNEEKSIDFELLVYRSDYTPDDTDGSDQTVPEPLDIDYRIEISDPDTYTAHVERTGETTGSLVIYGASSEAGSREAEIYLYAYCTTDESIQTSAYLLIEPITYELLDAPNDNTYVVAAEGETLQVSILCNSSQLQPLTVGDDWIRYDPSESIVEPMDEQALHTIQHHQLHIAPHTQGTDPRDAWISLRNEQDFSMLEFTLHQEVNYAADGREMVLLMRASAGNAQTVYLPLDDIVKCTIDWGDGSKEIYENTFTYDNPVHHVYAEAGEYHVTISGHVKEINSFRMPSGAQTNCLIAVEKWGNLGAEEITLQAITSLERIAPDTDGAFANIVVFDRTFAFCTGLTELPDGLFSQATSANTFELTFYKCSGLKSLPDGLFAEANPTTFDMTFANCTGLTELPEGLFRGCSSADLFNRTFEECTGLTSLPANLFAECPGVSRFKSTFHGCSGLTSIPAGLFAHNTEVSSFNGEVIYYEGISYQEYKGLFGECTGLRSIPEELFANCPNANGFTMAFIGCTGLESVPAKLFAANTQVTDLSSVFENCKSLTELPAGLLDNNTQLQDIDDMCSGCTSLERIPTDLFDNNRLINRCYLSFYSCSALQGESPYTEIDGVKYHLYDRSSNPIEFTMPNGDGCFTGCRNLSDYDSMPEEWR